MSSRNSLFLRQINIDNFVAALLNPKCHFSTLKDISVILDDRAVPILFTGMRSAVFKVEIDGELFGLKCYDCWDEKFIDGLKKLHKYFNSVDSGYINRSKLYENELTVEDIIGNSRVVAVELYSWIEGVTLSQFLDTRLYLGEIEEIGKLIDPVLELAKWLLSMPFAHGDIKADNLLIGKENSLTLIDWNNSYLPTMCCSPSNEIGSYGFRHPLRGVNHYNKRVDDYPLVVIISTLLTATYCSETFMESYGGEFAIFEPEQIVAERCEVYEKFIDQLSDNIVVSSFLKLLRANTPTVNGLLYWIEALISWRKSGDETFNDNCGEVLVFVDERNMWCGIASSNCKRVLVPPIFEDINIIDSGRYAARIEGKWGVIDNRGKVLQPFNYEFIGECRYGRILVKNSGKFGFVDNNFATITAFIYTEANGFTQNYAVVKRDGKFGYINLMGEEVIEPKYDLARNVRGGRAMVRDGEKYIELNFDLLPF